ncbi:MAG TPA: hypothetical protein VII08_22130 [Myxococcales bacterium]
MNSKLEDFEKSFTALPCDILLSTHPDASNFWTRLARRDSGDSYALVDRQTCAKYVEASRAALHSRIAKENGR